MVSKEAADAGPSDVATLKKLSVMVGSTELINGFTSGSDGTTYTGNVAAATSSVRVDAVASNSRAGVQVTSDAGRVTGNGPYTARLGAAGQDTEINVIVESADEDEMETQTYTITITRAGNSDSTQATLNSLTVTGTTISSMMPAFVPDAAPAAGGYVVYVADDVNDGHSHSRGDAQRCCCHLPITATNQNGTEAPESSGGVVTLDVAGNTTTVKVKVTAQDGFTAETYTINVMRASASTSPTATLSSLSVTAGGE